LISWEFSFLRSLYILVIRSVPCLMYN
jgi:hypothetical protein